MIPPPPIATLFPYTTLFRSPTVGRLRLDIGTHLAAEGQGDVAEDETGHQQHRDSLEQGHVLAAARSEEHTSELQSRRDLVCRLLLEKKKKKKNEKKESTKLK